MKKKLKGLYLIITSLFFYILHLPFAFAKSASSNKLFYSAPQSMNTVAQDSSGFFSSMQPLYDSLHLNITGLSRQAFDYAQEGLKKLVQQGKLLNDSLVSIVDFSLPSNKKRLFVIDLKNYQVLFNTLVAHGRNSGREMANTFSNQPSSYMSSPGFYITGDTYNGHNGYSLKLQGMEKGINDNAYDRAIVMHGANYVSNSFIAAQGFIGRSEGCPAVPVQEAMPIINMIKQGTCLFIYNPSEAYVQHSSVLNG
jgi:hypothetical protein